MSLLVGLFRPLYLLLVGVVSVLLKLLEVTLRVRYTERRWRLQEGVERLAPPREGRVDYALVGAVCSICALGLLMVYSASVTRAAHMMGSGVHFLRQQALFMGIGLTLMFFMSRLDYRFLKRYAWPLFWGSFALLALVFVPGVGREAKGASRWLMVGGVNVQPVEVVKLTFLLTLAKLFSESSVGARRHWLAFMCFALPVALLSKQPDFGSIIILGYLYSVALLLSGASQAFFLLVLAALSAAGTVMWFSYSHVSRRIYDFMAQFEEGAELGYNLKQALISFGSGRWVGEGIGRSSQKNFFLPESHTDFIFDIYGEELGFVGVLVLLALYATVFSRGLLAARRARDPFGGLLAAMITLLFFTQALVNMLMAVGMLPTKGLTLPLMSYGGSSLLLVCVALGALLNISRYRPSLSAASPAPALHSPAPPQAPTPHRSHA
ncbi:MAG: putative lipid II flippase FtsW [Deltaproteobacteria bacterium]|nr:putative lipid II flippase FtsW [Deltaproteobacteria bacterium]